MRYLLDTCVVSDFVKGDANTSQKLKSGSPEDIAVSAITSMELKYGLANNPQRAVKIQPPLILVTANVREFERIPNLQIQNWQIEKC